MSEPVAAPAARRGVSFEHLRRLMWPAGIVQFSQGDVPDWSSGTCLDDNARAWIVAMYALALDPEHPHAVDFGDRALRFVERSQRPDGAFHNLADAQGRFTDDIGSEESIGRAVWACGLASRCTLVKAWRETALVLLERAMPAVDQLVINHARAYAIFGLSMALAPATAAWPMQPVSDPLPAPLRIRLLALLQRVVVRFNVTLDEESRPGWPWWENTLTWGNGRLPEALIRSSTVLDDPQLLEAGLRSLDFLAEVTQPDRTLVPIGCDGWYPRGGTRALYDQQPIEACAMTEAWLSAHKATGDQKYLENARVAYSWFEGNNTEQLVMCVPETGASYDGLLHGGVNTNQGAESTISYAQARLALALASM